MYHYHKDKHALVEVPTMEKPEMAEDSKYDFPHGWDIDEYRKDLKVYEDHLASLRTINCAPGTSWEQDKDYEEGKDFALRKKCPHWFDSSICGRGGCDCAVYALPALGREQQEEDVYADLLLVLHKKAQSHVSAYGDAHPGLPNHQPWHDEAIAELKKQFTIKKK